MERPASSEVLYLVSPVVNGITESGPEMKKLKKFKKNVAVYDG